MTKSFFFYFKLFYEKKYRQMSFFFIKFYFQIIHSNFFLQWNKLFIIKNYIKKSTMTKFEKINPHEIIKVLHIFYYCIFIFLIYFININFFVKCDNNTLFLSIFLILSNFVNYDILWKLNLHYVFLKVWLYHEIMSFWILV